MHVSFIGFAILIEPVFPHSSENDRGPCFRRVGVKISRMVLAVYTLQ